LLAPTEVLAFQHYQKLRELINSAQTQWGWLETIFLTSKSIYWNQDKITKKELTKRVEQNQKKLFWIGTHALLHSQNLRPDLVMVDEQHRFGVEQRQKLTQKSARLLPHFVSFTATPIPRTLALTIYESLQPLFLQRLSGRSPIHTQISFFDNLESHVVSKIQSHLQQGRKVYVICTKVQEVENKEPDELWSVSQASKLLEKHFPEQVMTVHGKMSEKKDVLAEFKESVSKNILVATTVIEVGVDVPQASLAVILNAERFGLSALHQIRGRVGRNDLEDNECLLVTYFKYARSRRLKYLQESQDGFALAEKDLEIRGAGDMLGKLQSGFGDEIDKLIGLNPELYRQIGQLVSGLDLDNLGPLPRLQKYLQTKAQEVWKE
jgi:ATP-dependent DNA helicase RecG